jgi:hypothetical protein
MDPTSPEARRLTRPTPRTAENSTPSELWAASFRLAIWFTLLTLLVVPMLRESPLGPTGAAAVLGSLLVVLSLYWMLAGYGYRPLLILQLVAFSTAMVLLATKVALVLVGIERLSILQRAGKGMIILGAACAGINLVAMLIALIRRVRIVISPSREP